MRLWRVASKRISVLIFSPLITHQEPVGPDDRIFPKSDFYLRLREAFSVDAYAGGVCAGSNLFRLDLSTSRELLRIDKSWIWNVIEHQNA